MTGKNQKLIPMLMLLFCVLGCSYLSGGRDQEEIYAPTEVGVPQGESVRKDIGPVGGTLASSDGRLTLTVPQNALQETVPFSIQPITNTAASGSGAAYRLEPNGKTFTTPLQLSFHYADSDLEGTVPEALSMAYQDGKGAWHIQNNGTLDQTARTLTIPITHFSDFANLARLRLVPPKATVRVREAKIIQLLACPEPSFLDKLLSRPVTCEHPPRGAITWSLDGPGRIQQSGLGQQYGMAYVTYIAPDRRPNPNVAEVKLSAKFRTWHQETGETTIVEKTFFAKITIIDSAYRATGESGGLSFIGVICSLDQPFTVAGQSMLNFQFDFTPSSTTAGTVAISGSGYDVTINRGSGRYAVEGIYTDRPRIALTGNFTGTHPKAGSATGSGTRYIDLIPLEDGCGE